MPRYKKPLYTEVSQYIKDPNASSDFIGQGGGLVSRLEEEITHNRESTYNIFDQLNNMETALPSADDLHYDIYFRLFSTLLRSTRSTNSMFRKLQEIDNLRAIDTSIRFKLLDLVDDQPHHFTEGFIRPSQKLNIFYSKLLRKAMDLTDRQWNLMKRIFGIYIKEGAGRPPLPIRQVLNGIFWKIRTAASWDDLPGGYPSHQTCYRYFNKWIKDGTLDQAFQLLSSDLKSHGLDLYKAVQNSEIRFLPLPPRLLILLPPRLVDTWKGSTALLLLQVILAGLRKKGSYPKRVEQVYTSALDALNLFNAETDETQ